MELESSGVSRLLGGRRWLEGRDHALEVLTIGVDACFTLGSGCRMFGLGAETEGAQVGGLPSGELFAHHDVTHAVGRDDAARGRVLPVSLCHSLLQTATETARSGRYRSWVRSRRAVGQFPVRR